MVIRCRFPVWPSPKAIALTERASEAIAPTMMTARLGTTTRTSRTSSSTRRLLASNTPATTPSRTTTRGSAEAAAVRTRVRVGINRRGPGQHRRDVPQIHLAYDHRKNHASMTRMSFPTQSRQYRGQQQQQHHHRPRHQFRLHLSSPLAIRRRQRLTSGNQLASSIRGRTGPTARPLATACFSVYISVHNSLAQCDHDNQHTICI